MSSPSKSDKLDMMKDHLESVQAAPRKHYRINKTSMAYWFPKIKAAGLPVPKTRFVILPEVVKPILFAVFDGEPLEMIPELEIFEQDLLDKAKVVGVQGDSCRGFPIFLRTHLTSGKHDWARTCYVKERDKIMRHVLAIIEYSEMASFMGLDWSLWVVREMLPTTPAFYAFNKMPIVCEFRVFARDGKLICCHPYWPPDAIEGRTNAEDWRSLLNDLQSEDPSSAIKIALHASRAVPENAWSIDVLKVGLDWLVIDMALMSESYHWPNCPHTESRSA